ncbi:restriction endonuclease subunit S [Actinomyces sp.]|uniref:restriction endonuclease subunit S n=1 Tax=Actinomyces sp. TaxID=29317 RepID=UPI0026DD6A76|nr:restriction endonuclease subunit S [Actinomyces sp.]MDO4655952.1 restriction endonuclease subunit S [Actinomyces sp.]
MSRIDDLIRNLCPDGVEHKTLGEVGEFIRGNGIKKSDFIKQGYPCIHYGQIHTHYGISAAETISNISPEQAIRLQKAQPGDLIIATTSEDDDAVGKATAWLGTTPVAVGGDSYIFRHSMEPKYVSYFFSSTTFSQQKQAHITGSKVRRIAASSLSRITIPTPPIEVQHEITRTLDRFIQLEAELEGRQHQYAYYRDILVAPRSPRESVKLGEVSHIARGASPRPIRKFITNDNGIPWIKIGDVPPQGKYITTTAQHISTDGAEKSRQIKPGDFILSNSMSFGRPYIAKINGCIHDGWLVISNYEKTFDPDFLYHVLRSSPIQNGFAQRAGSGTVRNLNSRIVSETLVPAPPIDQQREIVHLLYKFDLLVNDLTSGLPAEIEARRKQYEYYRDRLLTFPEKK